MDNLKSILFVLPSTAIGGAEIRFFHIMKSLSGMRCILLTHSTVAEHFSNRGIPIHTFKEDGQCNPMRVSFSKTIRYARNIAKTVKDEKIDVIVGIMHTGCFYASVARDVFRLRVPLIGSILGNISAFFRKEERSSTFMEGLFLQYLLKRPSLIVVSSTGVRDDLLNNFGLSENKLAIVRNGIDIQTIQKMAMEPIDTGNEFSGKTILTACRLNAQKDFLTLLRAFGKVKKKIQSRLVILGEGELRDEILNSAKSLKIEKDIILMGFRENPFPFIKKADVFVLSSFFEGFGNVIVEAMALGVPVVATDSPSGPSEIIQHGISGLLVPIKDHDKMAEAILQLLTDDKKRNQLSSSGLERAASFRFETMIQEFRNIIAGVS